MKFFRSFKFNEDTLQKVYEFLEKDLNDEFSHLKEWNIAVIGSKTSKRSINIGNLNNVNTVSRSKERPDDMQLMKKTIYIKALMGAEDLLIDVDKEKYRKWKNEKEDSSREWDLVRKYREEILGKKPLLLVFPISKDSTPNKRKQKKNLILLNQDYHYLILVIWILKITNLMIFLELELFFLMSINLMHKSSCNLI